MQMTIKKEKKKEGKTKKRKGIARVKLIRKGEQKKESDSVAVPLRLFNTYTRKKEVFKSIKPGYVGMYTCGLTVYNYAHIGNLRTYVFEDLLKRVLRYNGYNVRHIMNITDVGHLTSDEDSGEDKMDLGAQRENKSPQEIANYYTAAFKNDLKHLNVIFPDLWCKATEHISDQIALIKKLEEKGYTYIGKNGNVYFNTAKFKKYGKLAMLNLKGSGQKARVEKDSEKKNARDFVLWFSLQGSKFKGHLLKWPSPWGDGFPGWHIECSAMSMKYLGENFDIHCGGIDHIPVHHTNEIAQSEVATGKKWVNYWLHGNFLVLGKEKKTSDDEDSTKMSKSLGNFITLQTLIERKYEPIAYRYMCLTAHYRKELVFSWQNMDAAQKTFNVLKNKVIEIKQNLERREMSGGGTLDYKKKFLEAINDDLNIPQALALFWQVLRNDQLSNNEKYALMLEFDQVFGLGLDNIQQEKTEIPESIRLLMKEREGARKNKDFKRSDEIRQKIFELGYRVEDTSEGQKVKKI